MRGKKRFVQVVMVGDSITWSAGVPFGLRYGDFIEAGLQERLGDGALVDVAVCGDGGDTAGQALLRLERDVLAYDPDAVLINLGCNNTIRERGHAERDLRAVVAGIRRRRPRSRIVLETIPTIVERLHVYRRHPDIVKAGGLLRVTRTRTNAVIRRVAGRYGLPVHDRFGMFQAAAAKDKSLNGLLICGDGIHLTAEGNRYFAPSAAELLAACLADMPEPRPRPARALLSDAEANPAYAACQAADRAVRSRAARVAALAAALAAFQHALPGEAHAPVAADRTGSIRWALAQLETAGSDPMAERLRRELRRRAAGRGAI